MKDKLRKVKKPAKLLKTKKKNVLETKKKTKKKMESMSVDDFMSEFMGNGDGLTDMPEGEKKLKAGKSAKVNGVAGRRKAPVDQEADSDEADLDDAGDIESDDMDDESGDEYESHKKDLSSLKKSDPEFYKYLQENDQDLLNFEDSDAESDGEKDDDKVHKPPNELEVASDESDYEPDEDVVGRRKGKSNKITRDMVAKWQAKLQGRCKVQDLRDVTEAFHAALVSVSPVEDTSSCYKVEGAVVFNAVVRMCVTDLLPAIKKFLKVKDFKMSPAKCRNWNKIKTILKNYLSDLAELSAATSPNMLRVLLKHIHQLCPIIVCFPVISPRFLKRVIQLWATDEDVIRVLAFLCALKLANLRPSLLRRALKTMHITYVRNTKFVTPNTLPGINFMRQSLCEMFALDNTISYHMVFLYIRQMAIHLRSAIIQKKKESYKMVYSWAFVSSLHLWAELFGIIPNDSPLRSLIYPLVQIIIGTIKLVPSAAYYPLRFHCCRILIHIRSKCDVFIPILPFLLEVLRDYNFKREHKKLTVKPLDFTCLLRCSKSQMKENGFKDAIMENIYNLLMEYLATECHRISFPDVTVPAVIQIKRFLKTCKFSNYSKKLKAVVDKIAENSKFIEAERKKLSLRISDVGGADAAEVGIRSRDPPLLKYYDSWKKIHIQQQARKLTNNHALGDLKLPVLSKLDSQRKKKAKSDGPVVLFPSDDEDDSDDGATAFDRDKSEPARKRKKRNDEDEDEESDGDDDDDGADDYDDEDDDGDDEVQEVAGGWLEDHEGDEDDEGDFEEDSDDDDDDGSDIVEDLNYKDLK